MKKREKFGGGQRVLHTSERRMTDTTIRTMIVETHKKGMDVIKVIDSLKNKKNHQRAFELLNFCPVIEQVLMAA